MESITIRPAGIDDAKKVAELLYLSMDWLEDFIALEDKAKVLDFLEQIVRIRDHAFSFDKIKLAEASEEIVGLLLSYPGRESMKLGLKTAFKLREIKDYFTIMRFLKLLWTNLTFEKADKEEYYISNLVVKNDYKELGISEKLLIHAQKISASYELKKISLLVKFDDERAKDLYYKNDYKIINVFKFSKLKLAKMIKDID